MTISERARIPPNDIARRVVHDAAGNEAVARDIGINPDHLSGQDVVLMTDVRVRRVAKRLRRCWPVQVNAVRRTPRDQDADVAADPVQVPGRTSLGHRGED